MNRPVTPSFASWVHKSLPEALSIANNPNSPSYALKFAWAVIRLAKENA